MRRTILLPATLLLMLVASVAGGASLKNRPAPPFTITTTAGEKVEPAGFRGKVVLIDFFASWCEPCREAVPTLAELHRKYAKKGLRVVGVAMNDEGRDLRQFVSEMKIPYPVGLGADRLSVDYGVLSIPTLVLIDRSGKVIDTYRGLSSQSEAALERRIRSLLGI